MNLILFEREELARPLPRSDPRARHLLEVLRRQVGEQADVGVVDGPLGKAVLRCLTPRELHLEFVWAGLPPPLPPISLIAGLARPQTSRRVLCQAAALGVARMCFVHTGRGEPGYAASRLWTTGEYRRHVLAGVAQAFSTREPVVEHGMELAAGLAAVARDARLRIALDNYASAVSLARVDVTAGPPLVLAVGAERGWTDAERDALRSHGFVLAHLGPRVQRTESAVVSGLAVLQARLGLWEEAVPAGRAD